jgi:signal transduction histidine kinase
VIEGLVNQWLYLARPASPKLARTDLIGALNQTLTSVHGQAEHAGVHIVAQDLDGMQVFVLADRPRLQQAVRNILMNAIQAMPSGGYLKATAVEEGAEVRITIQDTGAGFSPTALVRGTDLFFSEKEGGMGVGLNVAGEIISAHGGKMMFKNSPKGGAVVEIGLPTDAAHGQVLSSRE